MDLMKQVLAKLAENPLYELFLFGGKNELPLLNDLKQNLANVQVIPETLNFKQELQLIPHLDAMLSMDSGNAHIAAMYGVPVVSLWGHTHPFAGFVPFHQPLENSLVPDLERYPLLPTSVYGNKTVAGYEDVMRTIAPEKVVEKIDELTR